MSLTVRSVTIQGQSMALLLVDGERDFTASFEGEISTSFFLNYDGSANVTLNCRPRSADEGAKPLNKPPISF